MSLASVLNIPPLSKVQICSKRIVQESTLSSFNTSDRELPFWFFQCVVDGLLELRTPGGYMDRVSPHDICDVIPADPLVVQAMPKSRFLERLRLSQVERSATYGPHLFEAAQVMWVTKDKWGRVDAVHVRFLDNQYNDGDKPQACSIDDASRNFLNTVAQRSRMPVAKPRSAAPFTAQSRERKEHASARRRFSSFFRSALSAPVQPPIPLDV